MPLSFLFNESFCPLFGKFHLYSKVHTAIVTGIESSLVRVETDIGEGMPVFSMVGFLSNEVKEARERVRTALKNSGLSLPVKRITVNISPASIRKNGTGFDLPVAISILRAMGVIICEDERIEKTFFAGELGLDGTTRPIKGILPMVLSAVENNMKTCIVPKGNLDEARLVPGMGIIGVSSLAEVIIFLNGGGIAEECDQKEGTEETNGIDLGMHGGITDFKDINGMPFLRRACEIAVSGMHNMLMVGPPGSGKTFISKALPSIMPPLDSKEKLELSKIYSVCGLFGERKSLMDERPFRSPHHTVSDVGLCGGGSNPRPGEISLAHKGILFLDEMLEFKRQTLEILRQPLEEGKIHIARAQGEYTYPADFMLVGAMNPCPCGFYPDSVRCRCTPRQINAYLSRLSRPIADRIDICVEVPLVKYKDIMAKGDNESSESIRERVTNIHRLQKERFKGKGFSFNSKIGAPQIEEYCALGKEEEAFVNRIFDKYSLTARSYHKLLKVARTIADMDGKENIELPHLQEATLFRMEEGEGLYAGV